MNALEFVDNKGNKIRLSPNLKLKELVKMGLKDIRLLRPNDPLPDNWYRDNGTPLDPRSNQVTR